MTTERRHLICLLARFINAVDNANERANDAADLDDAFDAGEFSRPAHMRSLLNEQERIAQRFGFATFDLAMQVVDAVLPPARCGWFVMLDPRRIP